MRLNAWKRLNSDMKIFMVNRPNSLNTEYSNYIKIIIWGIISIGGRYTWVRTIMKSRQKRN